MVLAICIVLSIVGTFLIAAIVVGREAHRLDAVAPRSVYVPEEAVELPAASAEVTENLLSDGFSADDGVKVQLPKLSVRAVPITVLPL